MHPNVHSNTIYNSQDMDATQVSINRKNIKKMWYIYHIIYIYTYIYEYYSAIKRMKFCHLQQCGINQTEKDKYYRISLICGI